MESTKLEDYTTLKKKLKRQLEFYFSDANLNRDTWLRSKIHEFDNFYIPIELVMNFNKIKALTTDKDIFLNVCKNSDLLEVDESGEKIRRNKPFKRKSRSEAAACQTYIEGLPLDYTVEDIEEELKFLGNIVYVTIRKTERKFNGTAFVEFQTSQEAMTASNPIFTNGKPYTIQYFPVWLVQFRKENGTYKRSYADVTKTN